MRFPLLLLFKSQLLVSFSILGALPALALNYLIHASNNRIECSVLPLYAKETSGMQKSRFFSVLSFSFRSWSYKTVMYRIHIECIIHHTISNNMGSYSSILLMNEVSKSGPSLLANALSSFFLVGTARVILCFFLSALL